MPGNQFLHCWYFRVSLILLYTLWPVTVNHIWFWNFFHSNTSRVSLAAGCWLQAAGCRLVRSLTSFPLLFSPFQANVTRSSLQFPITHLWLSICLSVCLSICLSVCLSVHLVNYLFFICFLFVYLFCSFHFMKSKNHVFSNLKFFIITHKTK